MKCSPETERKARAIAARCAFGAVTLLFFGFLVMLGERWWEGPLFMGGILSVSALVVLFVNWLAGEISFCKEDDDG